jgi:hypothetical protein
MGEIKTKRTDLNVDEYLMSVEPEKKEDGQYRIKKSF